MRLVIAAVFAAISLTVASASDLLPGAEPVTREQVVADLEFLRDRWAPLEHSLTAETRQQMLQFVETQIANPTPGSKADLALTLARAMAFTGNNHTHPNFFFEPGSFRVVPISFWWFPEGAIVTRAHPDQRDLLGARIVSI